jgi:hypothetical protein
MTACSHALAITGTNARETAMVLRHRLEEMTGKFEGSFLISASAEESGPSANALSFNVSPHDAPDFAAEKILDELAALGWIALEEGGLTEEEEEQIRERLQELGYI